MSDLLGSESGGFLGFVWPERGGLGGFLRRRMGSRVCGGEFPVTETLLTPYRSLDLEVSPYYLLLTIEATGIVGLPVVLL